MCNLMSGLTVAVLSFVFQVFRNDFGQSIACLSKKFCSSATLLLGKHGELFVKHSMML